MSTVDLNKDKFLLDDGMDSIVIVKDLGDIPGGRSLEVKKLDTEGDVIKAGHVIIKKDTNKPVFLPLGVKDGNYVELPAGHSYVGVLKASVLKKDPRAAILTVGQVNAAAFHPGQGVYRSSYKNARRLAATETNTAYRTADYVRRQQLDFVVGIEVHLSGNHTLNGEPFEDICDHLAGKYPKDFKFTGWHPLCRCYTTTVLKTEEEMAEDDRRIMEGGEPMPSSESSNFVPDVPEKFKKWVDDNQERIKSAKSLPYFMRDNEKYIKPLTITPQARAGADEAQKFNEKMMMASTQKEDALLDNQISEVMAKAKEVGDTVQSIAVSIAQKYDARCTPINYKSAVSIRRKVNTERQNPLTSDYSPFDMKDTVRTTIVVEKSDIENVIATLSQETGVKLLGKKGVKRQYGENYIGYTGTIINVKMDNELIAEIQVNTPKMIYAKEKPEDAKRILGVDLWNKIRKETGMEGGLGHKYYEAYRVLNPNSNEAKKLKALSEKYYSHFTK